MVEFINSIREVRANSAPYQNWRQAQRDRDLQRQYLLNNTNISSDQLTTSQDYGKIVIDAVNVMDDFSENKAEDIEVLTQQLAGFGPLIGGAVGAVPLILYSMFSKTKNSIISTALTILPVAGMVASTAGMIIGGSVVQKKASRIARFQAREQELKDPKHFVNFTDEQLKEAQEIAKTFSDKDIEIQKETMNPVDNFKEVITSAKSLIKDKKAYEQWLKVNNQEELEREKLNSIPISENQLSEAKKHQDILFRTINKIDIASQEYSENVEMATNSLVGVGFAGGGFAGGLVSGVISVLQKLKVVSKNLSSVNQIKRYAVPALTFGLGLFTAIYAAKVQKEAARVGRFKAKQELLNDRTSFIHFNDQQFESVKDIKANPEENKSFFVSFKDHIKFFSKARKDFNEYKEYRKTDEAQDKKLKKAKMQVNVTPDQLVEAKKLQDKTFMVFEKMDEMSQRYSEDVEAATQIVQQGVAPFISLVGTATGMGIGLLCKANLFTAMASSMLITFPAVIGLEFWATKLQKKASKIGLMKAMEDLKDPGNFVDYTKEQLQAQNFEGKQAQAVNSLAVSSISKEQSLLNKQEAKNYVRGAAVQGWLNQISK